jgi:lysozyme
MMPPVVTRLVAAGTLVVSAAGVGLIQSFEVSPGRPVPLKAYDDGVGVWTLCWGHTTGVKPGSTATPADCDRYLKQDLATAENAVKRLVTKPISQPIFDSLVSWTLNLGTGKLASSTMLRRFNAGRLADGCTEMLKWDYAGGKKMKGLTRRRQAEYTMCMSGVPNAS